MKRENRPNYKKTVKSKNVLIFLSSYFPETNANVICAQLYIDKLKREGYKIDLVTCGNVEKDGLCKIQNDICVYRFSNWYVSKIQKINQSIEELLRKGGIQSKLSILALMMEKLFLHIYDLKNPDFVGMNLDKKSILRLVQEHEEWYDIMIAFTESFSMPWIASWIKSKLKRDVPLVICEFDPFTRNIAKNKYFLLKRKYAEKKVLSKADKIMIPPELVDEYKKDFPEFASKTVIQYFPNLLEQNVRSKVHNLDKVICSYAGSFDKNFRNPKALYEIISRINMDNLEIHIYGGGCEEETAQYMSLFRAKFFYHGYRDVNEVFEAQCESDILINIGNSMNNMTPSKVFELIALGKPIIHFYRTDDDACRKYLEKYPCVLFVDERNSYKESADKVEKFILQNKGKNFLYMEATAALSETRSDRVCAKFLNEIKELL